MRLNYWLRELVVGYGFVLGAVSTWRAVEACLDSEMDMAWGQCVASLCLLAVASLVQTLGVAS